MNFNRMLERIPDRGRNAHDIKFELKMNSNKFLRIAESLRQYRRAELKDFADELGHCPVDALYVDPLPNDAVLSSVLSSNTTFLLGRKGTGKSTVFARAQSILRERRDLLSIYIDVKTLYDIVNTAQPPVQNTIAKQTRAHAIDNATRINRTENCIRSVRTAMRSTPICTGRNLCAFDV